MNKNLNSYNTKFYRALRKYGINNFKYEILISTTFNYILKITLN